VDHLPLPGQGRLQTDTRPESSTRRRGVVKKSCTPCRPKPLRDGRPAPAGSAPVGPRRSLGDGHATRARFRPPSARIRHDGVQEGTGYPEQMRLEESPAISQLSASTPAVSAATGSGRLKVPL